MAQRRKRREDGESSPPRALLEELEARIEQLKIAYEKYFVGVERMPPAKAHEQVRRLVRQLERTRLNNTVLRFRSQGLKARLVTYEHYWNRILTQIENGTYRRELQKRSGSKARGKQAEDRSAAALPGGITDGEARALYRDLVAAKQAAGESTEGLSYRALAKKLQKEVPRLQQRHDCDGVRFEVATDPKGRVRLRARPR